jgi:hypothetical protein
VRTAEIGWNIFECVANPASTAPLHKLQFQILDFPFTTMRVQNACILKLFCLIHAVAASATVRGAKRDDQQHANPIPLSSNIEISRPRGSMTIQTHSARKARAMFEWNQDGESLKAVLLDIFRAGMGQMDGMAPGEVDGLAPVAKGMGNMMIEGVIAMKRGMGEMPAKGMQSKCTSNRFCGPF